MQIANQKVVTIDYTLTDQDGEVLDTSKGEKPLTYLHGTGSIIPGLEQALEGKSAGEAVQVKIPPEQAYGIRDEDLVQELPREKFPEGELEVGMRFEAQSELGMQIVTVVDLDDDTVTIDANHPLAGMTLAFDVTIVDVRDATIEELRHGHAHGAGGHAH